MSKVMIAALAPLLLGAAGPPPTLEIELHGLRNARGVIHACLTRKASGFPDCDKDPQALTATVPANAGTLRFAGYAPGRYAVSLFHDENGNGRLDKLAGIPREGFGFSRNPVIRFGAPAFAEADLDLTDGAAHQVIRLHYML